MANLFGIRHLFLYNKRKKNMSKGLQPTIYVDDYVSTVAQARDYAKRAEDARNELKQELWGLIMATPKDIAKSGEDPIESIKERFNYIWEDLWDAFIDDYKYNAIADDAEFIDGSLVQMQWDEEEDERKAFEERRKRMNEFFDKHKGVLNPNNFDDINLFNEWDDGNIEIPDSITKEERDRIVEKKKKDEIDMLNQRLKEFEGNE